MFSIIIPCYNQAHFLAQSLNSVIAQSYSNWEAIVIDDGSTDSTKEIAAEFALRDKRIKPISQPNGGLSNARNTGINASVGKYLVFLDSDDWLYPDFLNTMVKSFDNNTSVIISGYAHYKDNILLHEVSRPKRVLDIEDFSYSNFAPPVAFATRKTIFNHIGKFDETLNSAEDWDLWIRVAKAKLHIVNIPDVLAAYRYSNQSMSRDGKRMYLALKKVFLRVLERDTRIKISDQMIPSLDFSKGLLGILFPALGVLVVQGKLKEARELYHREVEVFSLKPTVSDFQKLNSYLTFRYWNTKEEMELIFSKLRPLIITFLESSLPNEFDIKRVDQAIFESCRKKHNHIRYGKLLGGFLNRVSF